MLDNNYIFLWKILLKEKKINKIQTLNTNIVNYVIE